MRFYYGYISGTYMHHSNYIGMIPCTHVKDIMEHTYEGDTSTSKLENFGLDNGWSSVVALETDIDLDCIATPIRSVMELLLEKKFSEARYMIQTMFAANVGIQELSIACCDKLMKFDKDGDIYTFLCENIPLFQTTLVNRTNYLLKQKELAKRNKRK